MFCLFTDLELSDTQLMNFPLAKIEDVLKLNGYSLSQVEGMPKPDNIVIQNGQNNLIAEELAYDVDEMQSEFNRLYPCLTDEQRIVYHKIIDAVSAGQGGVFFLY